MLSPDLIKKIKRIHIASAKAVDTAMSGHYRSVFRGSGIEFEEVREYSPGDEIKAIDWKVTARMGRPYIKMYREERELVIMLLVDMSASGLFGSTDNLKRDAATEIASVLAFNAIRNNDTVGAVLFTDKVEKYIPPKKGSAHVWRVIKEILSFTPESKGTDIACATEFLSKVMRKRAVTFVISDFLAQGYSDSLKRANRRHDCIAVVVNDPADFALPEAGIFEVEDLETGQTALVDCSDKQTRQAYTVYQKQRRELLRKELSRAKVDSMELSTDGSPADVLHAFFRTREKRIR